MHEAENYLFDGEEIALETRHHAVILLKPALFPLGGLVLFSAQPNRVTFLILLACAARFAWAYALWYKDRFVLTGNRILSTSGFITTSVVSMPLSKITDLTYSRSLGGVVLGYGKLHLESAGQMQLESIDYLPDPDHFYRCVMALALGPPTDDVGGEVAANERERPSAVFDFDFDDGSDEDPSTDESSRGGGRGDHRRDSQGKDGSNSKPREPMHFAKGAGEQDSRTDDSDSSDHENGGVESKQDRSGSSRHRETFEERRARILASRQSD